MSWNHRVARRVFKPDTAEQEITFGVYEAYYDSKEDSNRVTSLTVNPIAPVGETLEELKIVLQHYTTACHKPVLDYDTMLEISV